MFTISSSIFQELEQESEEGAAETGSKAEMLLVPEVGDGIDLVGDDVVPQKPRSVRETLK